MLLNLYGDEGLVFQTLATGFKEAHLQDKIKFDVVEAEKVGQKFKDAVKKAYNAKFLDDADMVIRFAIPSQEPVEQADGENQDSEGQDQGSDSENQNAEQQAAGDENKEETNEAQTTNSVVELKKKIVDTVKRCLFQQDTEKIELSDLEGYLEGYDVSFIKVSLKSKESPQEQ